MRDIITIPLIALAVLFGIGKFVPEKQSDASPAAAAVVTANNAAIASSIAASNAARRIVPPAPLAFTIAKASTVQQCRICQDCKGRGRIGIRRCQTCGGDGRLCPSDCTPKAAPKVTAKVDQSCGCGCPNCKCGARSVQQQGTTSTQRTYRSGPVRRFFGRGCCR